jgi:hypothetical protein
LTCSCLPILLLLLQLILLRLLLLLLLQLLQLLLVYNLWAQAPIGPHRGQRAT